MLHFTLVLIFSSKNSSQFLLKPDLSQWLATNQIKGNKSTNPKDFTSKGI